MNNEDLHKKLADKLRTAIYKEIARSPEVRSILSEITGHGVEAQVWVLMGVAFEKVRSISDESGESLNINSKDLEWLKTLNISIS